MRSKIGKLVVLNFILLSVLFPFQNCSNKINSEIISESLNSSLSTVEPEPVISFVEKTSLYNTRNVISNFSVTSAVPLTIKSIRCQLGNQATQDCSGQSVQSNNLSDGDYALKVVVEMVSGKIFELSRNFRIDATAPTLSISQTPASITNAQTAAFSFLSTDNLSGIISTECSVDSASYAICASPEALNGLAAGAHNIKIRTSDRAGNVSIIYSYNWVIDLSVPTVTLQSTPASVLASTMASFSFSGIGITSYECSIDNATYIACTSPKSYTGLSSAAHNFKVRGQNAQNVQSSAVSYNWVIDTVAPAKPVLTSSYEAVGSTKSGNFIFSSTDAGSGIKEHQCSLNNSAYALCSSPHVATAVEGVNNFKVKSYDLAGNVSIESVLTITVDTVKPVLNFTQSPALMTTQTAATFAFTASDAGSGLLSIQCALGSAAYANCVSPVNLSNLPVTAHKYSVQVKDNAGNTTTVEHSWVVSAVVQPPPPLPTVAMKTIFMASGHGARTVMSCDDGLTWINDRQDVGALDNDHSTTASRGIDSEGGYFFANFGWGYNGTLRRSRDGVNWDVVHDGSWGGGIAVGKSLILHVTEGQNWYTSSSVGASWTRLVNSNINSVNTLISYPAVVKLNNKIFVTGRNTALGISYDEGNTWAVIPNAYTANAEGRSFAEGNGIIISQSFLRATATTSAAASVIRSIDNGKTWATYPLPFNLGKLHFDGSQFVSLASAKVWRSTDGINWTSKPIIVDGKAPPSWWSIVSQFNVKTGTYVGILKVYGRTGALQFAYRSTDGESWMTLNPEKYTGGFTMHTITVGEIESKYCP